MTDSRPSRMFRHIVSASLFVASTILLTAGPVASQYGGTPSLFVDPVEVPFDATFDAVGFNCPGASSVTITIDGVSGTLGSTTAADDNSYVVNDVAMPPGSVPGENYVVRASCGGGSATFNITAVCSDGALPVGGECAGGGLTGGTTTTTTPGGGSGGPGGTTGTDGNNDGTNLAVTGAGFAEQIMQVGISLVALGAIVVLATSRRGDGASA